MKQVVAAPAVAPSATGLLQTVRPITGDDAHWQSGFSFAPNGCLPATIGNPQCDTDLTVSAEDLPAVVDFTPYLVIVSGHCTSLLSSSGSELGARVRAAVELEQGSQIENELWRGDVAQAESFPNLYLAGGSSVFENLTPSADDAIPGMYALSALQAGLARCNGGARGMIHAARQTVTMWQSMQLLRREGNAILDLYDNFVIAGAGYDGSDPDGDVDDTGGTQWAYATGIVDVRLSDVFSVPGLDQMAAALDRGRNDFMWTAQRFAAAVWDGCCHVGARVNVCETCCDPDALGS